VVALLILLSMIFSAGQVGPAPGTLGMPGSPESYAEILRPAGDPEPARRTILVHALDNLFLAAYTGVFAGFAALLWPRTRFLAGLGLSFALGLAVLDIVENAVVVQLARAALLDTQISRSQIGLLGLLTQVKYAFGGTAMVFFAAGLWQAGLIPRWQTALVSLAFLGFSVINALQVVRPGLAGLLIVWMLILLVLAIWVLRTGDRD
jgi:hypothetical protein